MALEINLKTQKSLIQNHQKFKRQSWPSLIIFSCSDIQSTTWKTMPSALARLCPRCPLSKIMSRQILSANGGRLLMNNLLILNATLRVCQIDLQIQENFHTSSIDESYHVTHTTGYLKKKTTVILIFCILAKNGEKVIYTAHGLLAVTSNSGVFSLHQFILFFAFFRCVNILFAPMMLETKYIGDNFEILCPLYGTNIDAVLSPRCAINVDLGFYPLCNQFDCSEWSFFLWSISRINFF